MFLSRTLSYKGAEFELCHAQLSEEFTKVYNECCVLWSRLKDGVQHANELIKYTKVLTP